MSGDVDFSLLQVKQAAYHIRAAAKHMEMAGMKEWVASLNAWADKLEPAIMEQDETEPEGAVVLDIKTGGRVN